MDRRWSIDKAKVFGICLLSTGLQEMGKGDTFGRRLQLQVPSALAVAYANLESSSAQQHTGWASSTPHGPHTIVAP